MQQFGTLRLILASVVVVAHAVQTFVTSYGLSPYISQVTGAAAWYSVLAFFVISGLFIGRSLIAKADLHDLMFMDFIARRIARIYPPLIASIVLTSSLGIALTALGSGNHAPVAATMPIRESYMFGAHYSYESLRSFGVFGGLSTTNGPLWSLDIEMKLYVLFGLAAQIVAARTAITRGVAILALAIIGRSIFLAMPMVYVIYYLAFSVGVALSFAPIERYLPNLLPIVSVDFSYSLYIMHFPVLLFGFFLVDGGGTADRIAEAILCTVAALGISYTSGRFLEGKATQIAVYRTLTTGVKLGIILPTAWAMACWSGRRHIQTREDK